MEKYPKYKDSGVKWIGEIPEHWEVNLLKRFIKDVKTGSTPKNIGDDHFNESGLPWFTPSDFSNTTILYNSEKRLSDKGAIQMRVFPSETILMIGIGGTMGKVALSYIDCSFNQQINAIITSDSINKKYLLFYLIAKRIDIYNTAKYTTLPILNQQETKRISALLPPPSEQLAIVSFLEKETSQIDSYIKLKEQEVERLNELKQAKIAHVVTKGLDPNVKMKDSGIAWIGEVPEHWEVKRIGAFYIDNNNKNSALEFTEAYKFNYGTLVRKDEGIKLEEVADVYSKYTIISKNDIIINGLNLNYDFISQRVAKVDKKGIITSAYVAITPREDVFTDYFIYLFKSMDDKKLFHGMGTGIRLTLGYNELKRQLIPIPPLSEQQQIATYIETKVNQIDTYISITKRVIEQMQEYKQRLISDAVTGKIKV